MLRNPGEPILERDYSVGQMYPSATPTVSRSYQFPDTRGNVTTQSDKSKKHEFLESLKEQMRMKDERKKMEKLRQLEDDRRVLAEEQEYQYFGKAGAGGVKKDYSGHTIASRKFDSGNVSNLYGRQSYNPMSRYPPASMALPVAGPGPDVERLYENKARLQEELQQQQELERKLKDEQRKREALAQKLDDERVLREREELRLKFVREQEEEARKRVGKTGAPVAVGTEDTATHVSVAVSRRPKKAAAAPLPDEPTANEVVTYKTNVKLQADLDPPSRPGEIGAEEFVKQLPEQVKAHVSHIVDSELLRMVNEMRSQEGRVMDSVVQLKVSEREV